MPCVSKCCCCCSLKYGYLTYGTICLILRICMLTSMMATNEGLKMVAHDSLYDRGSASSVVSIVIGLTGGYIGWFVATSFILFIALMGIAEKRSILVYPYIVVLILEIISAFITSIIEAVVYSPWMLLKLIFVGIIDCYALACTIGLYQHMKQKEKSRTVMLDAVPFKTV